MIRQKGLPMFVALGLLMAGPWNAEVRAAPSARLKIGWMPQGSYSQMQYTDQSGITMGSTIRVMVDFTWNNSEGNYNITPGGVEFQEDVGHSGQIQTCGGGGLEKTTLYGTPAQGQTTVRFQAIGWPTQQAHSGGWTARGTGSLAVE